jgi:rRNA maturation protein Nop10
MVEFVCQICGAAPGVYDIQCPNCGSKVSFEHNNPYSSEPVFQKRILTIGAAALALAVAVNAFTFTFAGAQVGAIFTSALGSTSGLFSPQDMDGASPIDSSETDETDQPDTDSSEENTYELTSSEVNEGYQEFESSGIAWRWATESEKSGFTCDSYSTTCTWIKVIALRDCYSVLINADVSTDSSTNTAEEIAVGYGNNDIDNSGIYAGDKSLIELGGSGDYPNGMLNYKSKQLSMSQ